MKDGVSADEEGVRLELLIGLSLGLRDASGTTFIFYAHPWRVMIGEQPQPHVTMFRFQPVRLISVVLSQCVRYFAFGAVA